MELLNQNYIGNLFLRLTTPRDNIAYKTEKRSIAIKSSQSEKKNIYIYLK